MERLRQMLASIKDFEPYSAFRRIDREHSGFLTGKKLCQFVRENGFREFQKEDFSFLIKYFDQDGDQKLDYHDFLQILLPCDDAFLRAQST
jgi:Ca2+-binding EF-hand superfamily protein